MFLVNLGLSPFYPFKTTNGYLILNALLVQLCLWICVFCKMDEKRGREKDERMAAGTRKRYSPNDSVKCHISAQLRERGGLCHFNKRGHWISGGYGEKLISLFSKVTWPVFIPLSDSLLFLNHSFMGSLLEKFTNKWNVIPSSFRLCVGENTGDLEKLRK